MPPRSKAAFAPHGPKVLITCAAFTCSLASPSPARAETDQRAGEIPEVPRRSALAAGAAIFPGLLVHGSGHFVAGDTRTGYRLLMLEGIGLGTLAVGFVPIVATGASRTLVGPAAALTVAGAGIFIVSMLADLYGVVAPRGGFGEPPVVAPSLQTAVGYRYVYNPVFRYRNFAVYEVDYRAGSWRVAPSAWFAFEHNVSRVRVPIAARLFGPRPANQASDGSFVDVEAAWTRHADIEDRFTITTGEVSGLGRLDMHRVAASLTGSFAELGIGVALQAYRYAVKDAGTDVAELLLARFGYGMYIGWPGGAQGEAMLYYDHRHDDFAAGLKARGIFSGVAGHFGLVARGYANEHWGVAVEAMAGSALVAGASLLFRQGGGR